MQCGKHMYILGRTGGRLRSSSGDSLPLKYTLLKSVTNLLQIYAISSLQEENDDGVLVEIRGRQRRRFHFDTAGGLTGQVEVEESSQEERVQDVADALKSEFG